MRGEGKGDGVEGCAPRPSLLDDTRCLFPVICALQAMVRNTPNAFAASRGLYYAWLYAPEVGDSPFRGGWLSGHPGSRPAITPSQAGWSASIVATLLLGCLRP